MARNVDSDIILRHEEMLRVAMLCSDVEALERLLADDLVFTSHLGSLHTKQDDIAAHRSRSISIRTINLSEMTIRSFENIGIVSVRAEIIGSFGAHEASGAFRFSRVWRRLGSGENLQVVIAHSTLIVAP